MAHVSSNCIAGIGHVHLLVMGITAILAADKYAIIQELVRNMLQLRIKHYRSREGIKIRDK
jgi:hypothetical protein